MVNIDVDNRNYKQENTLYFGGLWRYMETLLVTMSDYRNAIKETVLQRWEYLEFRILVFIFACVSCIPVTIFLVFWACFSCLVLFVSASVWLLLSTVALFVLLPFLIGSMGVAVGLVLVYQVCVIMKVSSTSIFNMGADITEDDPVTCDDNKKDPPSFS